MCRKDESGLVIHEQEVSLIPSRKVRLNSPSPIHLLFAVSAVMFLSIGAAYSWIWLQHTAAFMSTSGTAIDLSLLPGHWVATWTAAQQAQSIQSVVPELFSQNNTELSNTTIRQTFRMSIGGDRIRLRFSNAFADTALRIEAVTIALPDPEHNRTTGSGSARIQLDTLVPLTFSGARIVTIPPHGLVVSDVVGFKIRAEEVVTISMFFGNDQAVETLAGHRISRTTSWFVKGNQAASFTLRGLADVISHPHWLLVSAIEVWQSLDYHAVAMIGDSITDGRSATLNEDVRYTDILSHRLQRSGDGNDELKALSVVNLGIGGNQLLQDGIGPNLISRLDRDVLAVSGVKYAMVLEGTNDIGHARGTLADQRRQMNDVIVQLQQVITRLHAAGIVAFGGTIIPFACTDGLDPNNHARDPVKEQLRLKLNDWIRSSGAFDAVVDFDMMLRSPNNHTEMAPMFRSDDCEHPSDAGFREIANQFPIDLFARFKNGIEGYP